MLRLFALTYFHMLRFTFQFLGQFEWWQRYLEWVQWALIQVAKFWVMWMVLTLIAVLFWGDVLSLLALGFISWHAFRWRRNRQEAW